MKYVYLLSLLCGLGSFSSFGQTFRPDPCQLRGTVYIETVKSRADFSVYVDENSPNVDLVVCQVAKKLYADRPGLWHITTDRAIADFIIYIEKSRAGANIVIQYTPTESFAGCKN